MSEIDWREYLRVQAGLEVHPAADVDAMMQGDELAAMATDIKAHGMRVPLVLWTDVPLSGLPIYDPGTPGPRYLVDGRNRVAAMALAYAGDPDRFAAEIRRALQDAKIYFPRSNMPVPDAHALCESLNEFRRHNSPAARDKARVRRVELTASMVKDDPTRSDRSIARETGQSPTTIGKIRHNLEQAGAIESVPAHVDTKGRRQPAKKGGPSFRSRLKAMREASTTETLGDVSSFSNTGHAEPAPALRPVRVSIPEYQPPSPRRVIPVLSPGEDRVTINQKRVSRLEAVATAAEGIGRARRAVEKAVPFIHALGFGDDAVRIHDAITALQYAVCGTDLPLAGEDDVDLKTEAETASEPEPAPRDPAAGQRPSGAGKARPRRPKGSKNRPKPGGGKDK